MMLRTLALLPFLFLTPACERAQSPVQSGKTAAASVASQPLPTITALLPGRWETTTDIAALEDTTYTGLESDGLRAIADTLGGRKLTSLMCLPVDQARSPNALVIGGREFGACSFESFSLHRGTLDAVLTCVRPGQPGRALIAAHGRYAGASFTLDTVTRIEPETPYDDVKGPMPTPDSKPVRFHTRITGVHKGDCPAGEEVAQ